MQKKPSIQLNFAKTIMKINLARSSLQFFYASIIPIDYTSQKEIFFFKSPSSYSVITLRKEMNKNHKTHVEKLLIHSYINFGYTTINLIIQLQYLILS